MSDVSCIEVERLAAFFFFFTSLLHQSVTRGMSGRDRGMSVGEWVERDESAIIVGEGRDAG